MIILIVLYAIGYAWAFSLAMGDFKRAGPIDAFDVSMAFLGGLLSWGWVVCHYIAKWVNSR